MSTWIESHQDLRSNPKTRRAARALETTVPALMGHLHCLWHWALDHAEDGDVSPFDADDLADAAGWEGEAQTFVDALTDCGPGEKAGFLEPDGLIGDPDDGKRSPLALHDWWEYAGKLIAKRRKDAERKARARARDVPPPSDESPEGVQRTSDGQPSDLRVTAQVPNPTEPNPTEPRSKPSPDGGADAPLVNRVAAWMASEHGAEFEEQPSLYAMYAAVLGRASPLLPTDAKRHDVAMGMICEYAERVNGEKLPKDHRARLGRLLKNHLADAVLYGVSESMDNGAGLSGEHANNPKAWLDYVTKVVKVREGAA